MYTAGLHADGR